MTLKRPLVMQVTGADPEIEYSALDVRALFGTILRNEGILQALSPGTGALKVAQRAAGANFSVDVAAGAAVISGDDVASQGMYLVESTATENLVTPSPPGAGTRTHRVVARVKDKLHDGAWTTYEWTLEVLEDTGTGTPAVPDSAISLATVSIASGQVSVLDANITDTRANALLGPSRYTNISSTATRPIAPNTGETVYRTDIDGWELYDGTAWVELVRTGEWATYTPTWTASTSNPVIGNGTLQGRYRRTGSMVDLWLWLKAGTTTTFGSGLYSFSLPVTARTSASTLFHATGSAMLYDDSDSANHQNAGAYVHTSTTLRLIHDNVVASDHPWTWNDPDEMLVQLRYETA